ncbi:alcohol dehydrogenase [Colletotrichum scovillei]|uniref:Alcohol dehydrogenase n=1 Tax=Colletotrichum scovillei TaxID=1209932 RepID=A0A9P7R2Q5_9PEZI|nr:alcohol dehydrogenase [Colletotrichum scovillei]KAG7057006.1 alcohol dehydrogenase [Colletotrichum scovillei]KAG7066913.1 alcohol dehydrogenase [Colletotrichum scovillei]
MTSQPPQQRIFLTGASGYVGSVITELALKNGYQIHGLSRNKSSDSKLRSLGAVPIRGDLTSLDVIRHESKAADVVIHLATAYVFGGEPYETFRPIDTAAVDAIADALAGTDKPLVVTSGTLCVAADPTGAETTETSPADPEPINTRILTELHSLDLAKRGVRVMSIRLAPYVYGRGGSGVAQFMGIAAQTGGVTIVNGGKKRTTNVHVDDAARLFLLAAEKGRAGEIYNASSATDVTSFELSEAISAAVQVPLRDISMEIAKEQLGQTISFFLSTENRASGAKARKELGWDPRGLGILEDISKGSYVEVAKALKK